MSEPFRVLSLGWGCQSFGLAAMSAKGVLPKINAAINSDTTHERRETYEFAVRWTPWLEEHGIPVVTVQSPYTDVCQHWKNTRATMIPAFQTDLEGKPKGKQRRQCTNHWKRKPIRRWVRNNLTKDKYDLWLGITLDELERTKRPNDVKYEVRRYPYLEMFKPPVRRWQVVKWLEDNGLEVPVKSACVFCPFHSRDVWCEIKMSGNGDWEKALEADREIRHFEPDYVAYLTRHLKPLDEVDFESETDKGQLTLWDEECSGYCFS